jgi:hypothetical protein
VEWRNRRATSHRGWGVPGIRSDDVGRRV